MKFFRYLLKAETKYEKYENLMMLLLIIGASMLSVGIGLSILSPKGISAILAMFGSFLAFISTVGLIIVWTIKEMLE